MHKPTFSNNLLNIRQLTSNHPQNQDKMYKSARVAKNPIKVVVDMMGDDGYIHQKIVNQEQPNYNGRGRLSQHRSTRVLSKPEKYQYTPISVRDRERTKASGLTRAFVFNRFGYDSNKAFAIPRTMNSMPSKKVRNSNPNHRNIELIFCQNKLPDFVHKTNQKIEQIYKQQQLHEHTINQANIKKAIANNKLIERASVPQRSQKTNLASCLKDYATLEKLSLFMESDQQRREKCLCFEMEKDPSKNLLLDIITHRFTFLKKLNKRARDNLYRSLLGRPVNALSKINIQEYMKISEMFVGRDADPHQISVFMYIYLFGDKMPSFQHAKQRLQQINGHLHKLRNILEQLFDLMNEKGEQLLIDAFSKREKFLRLFIDYLIERQ